MFSGYIGSITKPPPGTLIDPLHPLSQGCVCRLLMNEGSGSRVHDISGHGNHGALKNMAPNAQGSGWGGSQFGRGLKFDGVNDYVDCGDKNDFALTTYSWSMWIKGNSAPGTSVVSQPLWNANEQFQFSWDHLNADFKHSAVHKSGDHWYKSQIASTLYADIWYFIVGTYDGTNIRVYLNGNLEDTNAAPAPNSTAGILGIGSTGAASFFNGSIDSVQIYNRALAAWETETLYHDPFCNLLRVPVRYVPAAPAAAIMNQFQNFNIGADLYNGAIIA